MAISQRHTGVSSDLFATCLGRCDTVPPSTTPLVSGVAKTCHLSSLWGTSGRGFKSRQPDKTPGQRAHLMASHLWRSTKGKPILPLVYDSADLWLDTLRASG